MAQRKILPASDPALRAKCKLVTDFDSKLNLLIDDMKETLLKADGAGLAANQIGILKQICIITIDDEYYELINPQITMRSKKMVSYLEGCLSVVDDFGEIPHQLISRHQKVTVKAQNRQGEWFTLELKGLIARAAQHEIDHLSGILYTDLIKKG